MIILSVNDLSLSFGAKDIFSNISFEVDESEKIGLIGINGSGKTSIFKVLTGDLPEIASVTGNVNKSKQLKLGYVEQHVSDLSDKIAYDEVLSVFSRFMEIELELDIISEKIKLGNLDDKELEKLVNKQANLQEYYQNNGGLVYKSMAKSTLLGLGFDEDMIKRKMTKLSGGEKSKVLLAKMLLSDSNLLLLDEPTNHLDIASVEWLEVFLQSYVGSAIVISHDRYFLDRVTNRTLELHNNRMSTYSGNYSTYVDKKSTSDDTVAKHFRNESREIKRLEGVVEQQRRWGREKNIKKAENFEKKIAKLKSALVVPDKPPSAIAFEFKAKTSSGEEVLMTESLAKSFGKKNIFSDIDLQVFAGERIFLLGANGSGKTTLLKTLVGKLPLDNGTIKLGAGVKIGYYDQNIANIEHKSSILDYIYDNHPKFTQTELRKALASFLFKGDDVFKQIYMLSGGEKARVSLLNLMLSGANFLIMDEPTNHLDMASREMLEDALAGYDGTQLVVSHDRYFINKLADKILYLENGHLEEFLGNYDEFSQTISERKEYTTLLTPQKQNASSDYFVQKEQKKELRMLKSAKKKAEKSVAEIESGIEELHAELCLQETINDHVLSAKLSQELHDANGELEKSFDDWTRLSEELLLVESQDFS